MYFRNYGLRKKWLDKYLKIPVSGHRSTVNTLKGPKHCWNLHGGTFIIYSHNFDGKKVENSLLWWNLKSYECLLTYWLPITIIVFVIKRIYRNPKNKMFFLNLWLYFWNLHRILTILKQTRTRTTYLFPKLRIVKDVVR